MSWEEYANTVTSLFNKLKEKGWSTYGGQNSDAMKLLNLYFTRREEKNEHDNRLPDSGRKPAEKTKKIH